MTSSLTLVTCSYRPDFERCRRLCETAKRYVPGEIQHLLIVPRRDAKIFDALVDHRTRVVTVESIVPRGFWRPPGSSKWWFTSFGLPVRGWIMQQITKISVPEAVDTEAVVFVDSDVVFIRDFDATALERDGALRLYRVPDAAKTGRHLLWHRESARLFGLPDRGYFGADYIGQLVAWRCADVRAMREQIERTTGRAWYKALARTLHFSEYILYGVYVEHVRGMEETRYWGDADDLCLASWHHDLSDPAGQETFLTSLTPRQVAVLIQSNLDLPQEEADRLVAEVIERNGLADTTDGFGVTRAAPGTGRWKTCCGSIAETGGRLGRDGAADDELPGRRPRADLPVGPGAGPGGSRVAFGKVSLKLF